MAVTIAEYLGQRTDSNITIQPCEVPASTLASVAICPFNNLPCSKIMKGFKERIEGQVPDESTKQAKHPVCSLRKNDGTFYIVCEDRLISGSTAQISDYQKEMLLQVAKWVFSPELVLSQVGYKSEVRIQTGDTQKQHHKADFILAVDDSVTKTYGHRRILLEIQGGGETNNTGMITRHIEHWWRSDAPNNELLRQNITKAGTIETNAWRRFQEQLFAKATTAKKSQCGFAVALGTVVFDYIIGTIPKLREIKLRPENPGWDTA
jgi:hypothetical protein